MLNDPDDYPYADEDYYEDGDDFTDDSWYDDYWEPEEDEEEEDTYVLPKDVEDLL